MSNFIKKIKLGFLHSPVYSTIEEMNSRTRFNKIYYITYTYKNSVYFDEITFYDKSLYIEFLLKHGDDIDHDAKFY